MLRYDLNFTSYGIPGLTFMTRYARGSGADYSNANQFYMRTDDNGNPLDNQKRWERDVEVKYVVQTGPAKICPSGCARQPRVPLLSNRIWMKLV